MVLIRLQPTGAVGTLGLAMLRMSPLAAVVILALAFVRSLF